MLIDIILINTHNSRNSTSKANPTIYRDGINPTHLLLFWGWLVAVYHKNKGDNYDRPS